MPTCSLYTVGGILLVLSLEAGSLLSSIGYSNRRESAVFKGLFNSNCEIK